MKAGDFVWVTGQVATDFQTGVAAEARTNPAFWYGSPIKLQADFTLRQLGEILEDAGSSLGRVVRADVYLTDMNDVYELEEVWRKYFPENPPARTTIPMNRLAPKDCIIEINVIALRGRAGLKKRRSPLRTSPRPTFISRTPSGPGNYCSSRGCAPPISAKGSRPRRGFIRKCPGSGLPPRNRPLTFWKIWKRSAAAREPI